MPGDAGVAWLTGLVKNGVHVTVLTNSLASNDVTSVHSGYKRYREALVDGGVRLYELRPEAINYTRKENKERHLQGSRAALHAKTFVFDRRAVFIGSLNLDPRSIALNTEIGVVCENPAMAESLLGPLETQTRPDRLATRACPGRGRQASAGLGRDGWQGCPAADGGAWSVHLAPDERLVLRGPADRIHALTAGCATADWP